MASILGLGSQSGLAFPPPFISQRGTPGRFDFQGLRSNSQPLAIKGYGITEERFSCLVRLVFRTGSSCSQAVQKNAPDPRVFDFSVWGSRTYVGGRVADKKRRRLDGRGARWLSRHLQPSGKLLTPQSPDWTKENPQCLSANKRTSFPVGV